MKTSLVVAVISIITLGVCGSCSQKAAAPPATPSVAPTPLISDSKSPRAGVVHIADDIRKACGIDDADAHFAFDSANLGQSDRPVLGQLATCFVSGPLNGREMRLVGHADPRGGDDYNMVLGGSRADTVKTFLTMRGVPGGRIATTSRGELDAHGTDETTWAEDRRVDVVLH